MWSAESTFYGTNVKVSHQRSEEKSICSPCRPSRQACARGRSTQPHNRWWGNHCLCTSSPSGPNCKSCGIHTVVASTVGVTQASPLYGTLPKLSLGTFEAGEPGCVVGNSLAPKGLSTHFLDRERGFPLIILKPGGKALRPGPPFFLSPSPRFW